MREIEVKAKIADQSQIINALNKLGCSFAGAVTQYDVVYVKNPGSAETLLSNEVVLRLRTINNKKTFLQPKRERLPNWMC